MKGGAKGAVRTYRGTGVAVDEIIYPQSNPPENPTTLDFRELVIPLMRDGEIVDGQEDLEASREHLAKQRETLPWEGLSLSRDEPAVRTRFIGFPEE